MKKLLVTALAAALLNLAAAAVPPANDDFAGAEVIAGTSGTVNGSNQEATLESGEFDHGYHSIWYKWTAPADGEVSFDTLGSGFDTELIAATGASVSTTTVLAFNDDLGLAVESGFSFPVFAGSDYYIRITSYASGTTHATVLNWRLFDAPTNDNFADAAALAGDSGTISDNNILATVEAGENFGSNWSLWFSWVATYTGTAEFDTLGSTTDTTLVFGTGADLATFNVLAANDDSSATFGTSSRVRVPVTTGTTYRIRVGSVNGGGDFVLNWAETNYSPSVIRFDSATYRISEAGAVADITFSRTIGTDDDAVSATFYTEGVSAISGVDYEDRIVRVTFAAGETTATVTVPIIDDRRFEGEETVLLHLGDPSETANLGLSLATLLITEDEPFIPLKANYAALVKPAAFDQAFTGMLSLKADGFGNVTGSLTLGGSKLRIMTRFDGQGLASVTWPRAGLPALVLTLVHASEGDVIRASVTDGTNTATANALRIVFGLRVPIATGTASFTVLLPGDRLAVGDIPQGDGFFSVFHNRFGSVRLVGWLADGTPVSAAGPLVFDDRFPFHIPLYRGKRGSLSGELTLVKGLGTGARLEWYKPADATHRTFKAGFQLPIAASVLPYFRQQPRRILPVLDGSHGLAEFRAGLAGLPPAGLQQLFNLNEANRVFLPLQPQVKVRIRITPANGLFTGSFQSGAAAPIEFKGALFQGIDLASGYFLAPVSGAPASGFIEFSSAY